MKQSKIYRRLLAVAMAAIMVVSLTNGMSVSRARAAETGSNGRLTWEKVENDGNGKLAGKTVEDAQLFEENYVKEGMVRASIVLEGEATLKKFPAKGIATNASAKSYRKSLRAEQDALAETISAKVLNGEKLDVVWNITLAANMISANIPYAKIDEIRMVKGVRNVVLETRYEPDVVSTEENDPNMATSSDMVGGTYAWAAGLTGAGSKIAIVDTGLDKEHQSYDGAALEKALEGKDVDLLTAAEVEAVFDSLNASQFLSSASGIYNSTKIPYGVNYVDGDLDITHVNDTQGNHGSHVAGIAAANRYIPDGNGGFVESMKSVMTQGEAPDAQLMIMKVFGKGGGAYDSDYMVAIEDAIALGADAVNLSLGSGAPGLAYNSTYADILSEVSEATNLVWANSAGNSYGWPDYSSVGYLYADDVSFATGGSPATYNPTFSVASVVNKGSTAYSFEVGGKTIYYTETSGYGNEPMHTIGGEYEYVLIDGPGVDDNDHVGLEGDQFLELGEEIVKGKIAMCFRGTSSFFAKANAAVAQGAVGVVIINNQDGIINMNLTGYSYTAPAVSITQADGYGIIADSTPVTDNEGNVLYYTGTINIGEQLGVNNPGDPAYYEMSEFSSWGVPGNLSLKPEITAPGGSIYSISGYHQKPASEGGGFGGGHTEYEVMSGTSMASPQIAGLSAVFAQYIRENDLTTKTGRTQRQLTLSLLMSTAEPMWDEYGDIIPVIRQGSGLANVAAAISAKSYITIDSVAENAPLTAADAIAEGKVKVELGEVKADSFTTTFTLHNFSDEKVDYYLDAEFFTQWIYQNYYRTPYVDPLYLAYSWVVDGEAYEPLPADMYDFNGDGVANGQDAQYLLEYCAELHEELFCEEFADLDEDGDIDTFDARIAFEGLNGAAVQVDKKDVTVTLTVSGLDNALGNAINGNYIEGYIYVTEGETNDGALGVRHSIPVLGYYGNWTDGSMFDKGSVIEYYYGYETRNPYVYNVTGGTTSVYVAGYIVDDNFFIGNAFADDAYLDDPDTPLYLPERNAINKDAIVNGIQYTQIRNAGAGRFFVADAEGNLIAGTEQRFGSSYSAYYYVNGSTWRGATTNQKLNFTPKNLAEDEQYTLVYQLAPEYYLNADGSVRWDELGEGASFTLPITVDNTRPTLVKGEYDAETKALAVEAKDNQYIAAVALYTGDGELINYYGGIADLAKGEAYTYGFDLSEVLTGAEDDPVHFLVEIYDYAKNLTTYKLNLNPEEADDPIQVKIDQDAEDALIVNNGTLQLTATVTPWGYASEEVIWTSSDETKATVDENGLVTSVATDDCTVTITATSAQDQTASDSIVVTIAFLHQYLNGIVWDEEGQVWMSKFDIGGLPNYEKLNKTALRTRIASAAYDEKGTLYACTFDTDEYTSILYTVNEEDWTFTEVGASEFGFMDLCEAPSLGEDHLLAIYGPYVLIISKTTGQYEGAFDFGSRYLSGANIVGIAFEEVYKHSSYGNTDWVWIVDDTGTVWQAGFLPYNGSYANFTPSAVGQIGPEVSEPYFQSLYYDGTSLFWSRFVEADNKVDLIMVDDVYNDGSVYNLGSFADGVWPVGGLYEQGKNPFFGPITNMADHSDAVLDEESIMKTTIEPLDFGKKVQKAGGSLNAVKSDGNKTEPDKISTEVKVELTAEELTKNGLVTIEYPETVELVKWSSNAQFKAWNDKEAGKIVFAFVDLEGFEKDEVYLTLAFSKESAGQVKITTSDINEDDENEVVEYVDLGFAVHDHIYAEPTWEWAEDYSSAKATFKCILKDDTQVVDAEVTFEDDVDAGVRTYTAKVVFQDKEYTDTKTTDSQVKFQVKISSETSEGTGAVTGSVYADFAARLAITGTKVNTSNAAIRVLLKNVASLGIEGAHSYEKNFTFDSNQDVATSVIANLFKPLDGTVVIGKSGDKEVTYKVEMAKEGYEYNALPDSTEAARAVWHEIFNEEHIEAGQKGEVDSYAIIANGSSLAVGGSILEFEIEEDLKLDNFNDLAALEKAIRDAIALHEAEEATEDVVITLKAGTRLDVNSRYVELLKDAVITISGECIDTEALETMLEELRAVDTSADTTALMKSLFGMLDSLINMIGGETVTVTVEFPEEEEAFGIRAYGNSYYENAFVVANRMKAALGVKAFETIVVARGTGEKGFADALGGSYLAAVKNAPILLIADPSDESEETVRKAVEAYILENLKKGGKVYLVGGESSISPEFANELTAAGIDVTRLAGADRYLTNIAILEEVGVEEGAEVLVVDGANFPDSLSAGSVGLPIVLVKGTNTKALTDEQKALFEGLKAKNCTFTVVGGEGSVIPKKFDQVAAYGETRRVAGNDRFLTALEVAKTYSPAADKIVIFNGTSANGYCDGLIAGALAAAIDAPVIMTNNNKKITAQLNEFVGGLTLNRIYVIGNEEVVTDNTVLQITGLESMEGFVTYTE